ncbi:MAG: hypothetical protein V3V08_13460 [Nannocystaceae bacterium]
MEYADAVDGFTCEYDPDQGGTCGSEARRRRDECGEASQEQVVNACSDVYDPCPAPIYWP